MHYYLLLLNEIYRMSHYVISGAEIWCASSAHIKTCSSDFCSDGLCHRRPRQDKFVSDTFYHKSCRCWYKNTSLSTTLTPFLTATSHRLVFQKFCCGNHIILLTRPQKNLSAIFILSNLVPSTSRSLVFSLLWPRSQGTRSWPSLSNRVFEDSPHNCIVVLRAQKKCPEITKLPASMHQYTNTRFVLILRVPKHRKSEQNEPWWLRPACAILFRSVSHYTDFWLLSRVSAPLKWLLLSLVKFKCVLELGEPMVRKATGGVWWLLLILSLLDLQIIRMSLSTE